MRVGEDDFAISLTRRRRPAKGKDAATVRVSAVERCAKQGLCPRLGQDGGCQSVWPTSSRHCGGGLVLNPPGPASCPRQSERFSSPRCVALAWRVDRRPARLRPDEAWSQQTSPASLTGRIWPKSQPGRPRRTMRGGAGALAVRRGPVDHGPRGISVPRRRPL